MASLSGDDRLLIMSRARGRSRLDLRRSCGADESGAPHACKHTCSHVNRPCIKAQDPFTFQYQSINQGRVHARVAVISERLLSITELARKKNDSTLQKFSSKMMKQARSLLVFKGSEGKV